MLEQLTTSIRRRAVETLDPRGEFALRNADVMADHPVVTRQNELDSLRGVTTAAADTAPCACPEACERDHANE
jgi:hypothetical protein